MGYGIIYWEKNNNIALGPWGPGDWVNNMLGTRPGKRLQFAKWKIHPFLLGNTR